MSKIYNIQQAGTQRASTVNFGMSRSNLGKIPSALDTYAGNKLTRKNPKS